MFSQTERLSTKELRVDPKTQVFKNIRLIIDEDQMNVFFYYNEAVLQGGRDILSTNNIDTSKIFL